MVRLNHTYQKLSYLISLRSHILHAVQDEVDITVKMFLFHILQRNTHMYR